MTHRLWKVALTLAIGIVATSQAMSQSTSATQSTVTPPTAPQPAATLPTEETLAQNAALKYWLAVEQLETNMVNDKTSEAIHSVLDNLTPVDEKVLKFITANEPALRELHRGAKMPQCVWGLPYEDGEDMRIPPTSKMNVLTMAACLRAEWCFQQGKSAEALDDLLDTFTLARHIASSRIGITGGMADYSMEIRAMRIAAGNLNKLKPAELKYFAERLDQLPPAVTFREALLVEKQIGLEWMIRTLGEPNGREKVFRLYFDVTMTTSWDPHSSPPNEKPSEGVAESPHKIIHRLSQQQLLEAAIALRPVYDELIAKLELPQVDAKKTEKDVLSDAKLSDATRALGQVMISFSSFHTSEMKYRTYWTMFKAAIAVCEHGETVLSEGIYKDPSTGERFQYEKTQDGFRLQSKTLDFEKKPLTLKIGG
jgi:hypothetical protein